MERIREDLKALRAEMVDLRRDLYADHLALQRQMLWIVAAATIVVIGLLGAFVAAQS